jgi:hypothetical protein
MSIDSMIVATLHHVKRMQDAAPNKGGVS